MSREDEIWATSRDFSRDENEAPARGSLTARAIEGGALDEDLRDYMRGDAEGYYQRLIRAARALSARLDEEIEPTFLLGVMTERIRELGF